MEPHFTVFVCSTYDDLIEERDAVLDAIRKVQMQHNCMEFFGARSSRPIETCLEEVRKSDIMLTIVGHRYGSLVPGMSISYSEAEYSEGQRLNKVCLAYIMDDNVPVLPKNMERDPEKIPLLERYKQTLRTRHTVKSFSSALDLAVSIAADLSETAQTILETNRDIPQPEVLEETSFKSELYQAAQVALSIGIPQDKILSTFRQVVSSLLRPEEKHRPRVFFSYSHMDSQIVRAIAEKLKKFPIDVWVDVREIKTGDSIVKAVSDSIDSADFVIIFMSRQSLGSSWTRREIDIAISKRLSQSGGAIILPVLLEDVEIPPLLRDVKYLDLRSGTVTKGVEMIANAIRFHKAVNKGIMFAPEGYKTAIQEDYVLTCPNCGSIDLTSHASYLSEQGEFIGDEADPCIVCNNCGATDIAVKMVKKQMLDWPRTT